VGRRGGAGYHLRLTTPPLFIKGGVVERARLLNRALEDLIRRCPQQDLWGYNRYKIPSGAPPPELETRNSKPETKKC
jgi:KDO2-lipid IV(A) lauroyltransferase